MKRASTLLALVGLVAWWLWRGVREETKAADWHTSLCVICGEWFTTRAAHPSPPLGLREWIADVRRTFGQELDAGYAAAIDELERRLGSRP